MAGIFRQGGSALRPPRPGEHLALIALLLFAASDVIAKYVSVRFHPLQIAWFRHAVACLFLVGICLRFGTPARSVIAYDQVIRGLDIVFGTTPDVMTVDHRQRSGCLQSIGQTA